MKILDFGKMRAGDIVTIRITGEPWESKHDGTHMLIEPPNNNLSDTAAEILSVERPFVFPRKILAIISAPVPHSSIKRQRWVRAENGRWYTMNGPMRAVSTDGATGNDDEAWIARAYDDLRVEFEGVDD